MLGFLGVSSVLRLLPHLLCTPGIVIASDPRFCRIRRLLLLCRIRRLLLLRRIRLLLLRVLPLRLPLLRLLLIFLGLLLTTCPPRLLCRVLRLLLRRRHRLQLRVRSLTLFLLRPPCLPLPLCLSMSQICIFCSAPVLSSFIISLIDRA